MGDCYISFVAIDYEVSIKMNDKSYDFKGDIELAFTGDHGDQFKLDLNKNTWV